MKNNLSPEIEVVKEVFAAINRNDVPAILNLFDSQIVRIEPQGFPMTGIYRGHAEVQAHFSEALETWAEGSCEPERFLVVGDKVIVYVYVHVRLKNKSEWIEGRLAEVFTFRNGKVIEMRTFEKEEQAIEWANLS